VPLAAAATSLAYQISACPNPVGACANRLSFCSPTTISGQTPIKAIEALDVQMHGVEKSDGTIVAYFTLLGQQELFTTQWQNQEGRCSIWVMLS